MAMIRDNRGAPGRVAPAGSCPAGSVPTAPALGDLALAPSCLVLSSAARVHPSGTSEAPTGASPFDARSAKEQSVYAKNVASAPSKISALVKLVSRLREFEEVGGETASAVEGAEVATEEIEQEVEATESASAAAINSSGTALARAGEAIKTGVGVLGTVAGAAQAAYGGAELHDGKTLNGAADLAGGGLNLLAGVSQLSSTVSGGVAGALKAVGAVDAIGSKVPVAGPLAGAAAAIGGGVQLYQGIEGHDTEKAALGGLQAAAGGIMVAGAFLDGTVAGAPLGVAMNAVGGAVLLGTAAWEHRKAIEGVVSSGASWVGHELAQL